MNKNLNAAVAKLHLEPGDALVVDVRVFTRPEDMMFSGPVARDCRIFAVQPNFGETVRDAFTTIHARQLESMTQNKLFEMLRVFCSANDRPEALIDGIEQDFCKCGDDDMLSDRCAIHERCAVLRALISPLAYKEPADATV